jgi:membrane protease YdiL (CAAX protease family)
MKPALVWLGAFAAGAIAWVASPELAWPARLLAAVLLGPAPVLFMFQARAAESISGPLPRIPVYLGSIIGLWLLALVSVLAARTSDFAWAMIGVTSISAKAFLGWTSFGILASALVVALFKLFGSTEADIMREITPVSGAEKAVFVLLSISAGVCEEMTFRGFLMPALTAATDSRAAGLAVSSLAFGVLHAHQRTTGALRAAMLGALLAVPVVVTGSLYPSMAAHAIVDIAGGLWLARWLFK